MEPMTDKSFNYIEHTYSKVKHTLEWEKEYMAKLGQDSKLTVDDWLDSWSINIYRTAEYHHFDIDTENGWLIKEVRSNDQLTYYKFTEECKDYLRMMLVL